MKFAVRWLVIAVAVAVVLWLWLGRGKPGDSRAATPDALAEESAAAPEDLSDTTKGAEDSTATGSSPQTRVQTEVEAPKTTDTNAPTTPTALVRVRVFSKERGAPLAGKVIVARPDGATTWSTTGVKSSRAGVGEAPTTDEHGRVEFTVAARTAHFVMLMERMQGEHVEVPALEPDATHDVDFAVATEDDFTFVGRVVDAETRAAIVGASVRAQSTPAGRDFPALEPTESDELGHFEIRARSWENRIVRVDAKGYPWTVVALRRGHGTRVDALEIPIARAATADVVVSYGSRTLAGAKVELSIKSRHLEIVHDTRSRFFLDEDPTWSADTDANGVARLTALPVRVPLQLAVIIDGERHVEANSVVLEPGETRRIEVSLNSGVTVLGRLVSSSGVPEVGAEIWRVAASSPRPCFLSPHGAPAATTRSDDDGHFVFQDVSAGDWWIGVAPTSSAKTDETLAPYATFVAVRGDEGSIELSLRTDVGLYIRGRVLDVDGKPTDSAVLVKCELLGIWDYANSDKENGFVVGPLVYADYNVVAGAFGATRVGSNEVRVPAGTSGVELQLSRGGVLTVRIAPIGGEQIETGLLLALAGNEYGWLKTSTTNGVRKFDGLASGVYSIAARTSGGFCVLRTGLVVSVDEPTQEVELVLQRGAILDVRYEGPDKSCNCQLFVDGLVVDAADIDRGTVARLIAPAGMVELRRNLPKGQMPEVHVLTLAAGERREIVLGK